MTARKTTRKTASGTAAKKKTTTRKKAAPAGAKKAAPKKKAASAATKKTSQAAPRKKAPAAKKATASPPTPKSAGAPPAETPKSTGPINSRDVNLGHVFALRPRVSTSFPQEEFRSAREFLSDQGFESIEAAARAVVDKALESTRKGKGGGKQSGRRKFGRR